ncbi:MAG: acyltransferase [Clostridia bacterium]|nr:acyltransferase [Clostridia bacterium]
MQEREHVHYFDYLRILAAFFVIYMHVSAHALRGEINIQWHFINGTVSLAFTAVPLFFMMSGYLLLTSDGTNDIPSLLKRRLPKLILPLIFWSLTAIITRLYYTDALSAKNIFDAAIEAFNSPAMVHLWYVYTLFALYLIAPVLYNGLKNLSRGGHALVLVIILLVSIKPALQAVLPQSLDRFLEFKLITQMGFLGNHLCTFILGFYLGKLKKKIPNSLLIVAILAIWGLITFGTYRLSTTEYNQAFQNQSAGWEIFLAAAIFLLFKQVANKKSKILSRIPVIALSLPIYMMHNVLLYGMERNDIIAHSFTDTVLNSILIYAICFVVTKTLATIKPLCYLTTGIPFKKASKTCNWIFTFKKPSI